MTKGCAAGRKLVCLQLCSRVLYCAPGGLGTVAVFSGPKEVLVQLI